MGDLSIIVAKPYSIYLGRIIVSGGRRGTHESSF